MWQKCRIMADIKNKFITQKKFNFNVLLTFTLLSLTGSFLLPVSANEAYKRDTKIAINPVIYSNSLITVMPNTQSYQPMTYGQLGNRITIEQHGSSLSVNAIQQGQHNYMQLSQLGISDGVNGIESLQIGSGNVQVASQSGINEQANDSLSIDATLKQNGTDNGLWIDQGGDILAANIEQLGSENKTYATQNGEKHLLNVKQSGFNNNAITHQLGLNHTLTVNQIGNNNNALAKQEGYGSHQANIYQQGNSNNAILIQSSDNALSPASISQVGNGMAIIILRY